MPIPGIDDKLMPTTVSLCRRVLPLFHPNVAIVFRPALEGGGGPGKASALNIRTGSEVAYALSYINENRVSIYPSTFF
jgi:hypothetical protein